MSRFFVIAVAAALFVTACGDSSTTTTTQGTTTTSATATNTVDHPAYLVFREQPTLCGADRPPPAADLQFTTPLDQELTGPVTATLHTSCGPITMILDPGLAPETVNSFVFLARQGYFNGTAFHRIVEDFVIQGGDPTASGTGGPGYRLPDEFPPDGFTYAKGVVAMANAGAGTTGSQFFIMLETQPLPPQFTVIGEVVGSDDTIDAIVAGPRRLGGIDTSPSIPIETIYIERVEIDG